MSSKQMKADVFEDLIENVYWGCVKRAEMEGEYDIVMGFRMKEDFFKKHFADGLKKFIEVEEG